MDDDEITRAVDSGYRAIGRWVVEFSRLIGGMRANMEERLRRPDDESTLVTLAFGASTAGEISDSFFAMCRVVGELEDAEKNIANQLQNEVDETIRTRNKIAHGDWLVGVPHDPDDAAQTYLVRVQPNLREAPHRKVEALTAKDLDKRSDRISALCGLTFPFGLLALRLPILTFGGLAKPGTYRVRDVLVAENVPKSGKGGQVVKSGPRASELI